MVKFQGTVTQEGWSVSFESITQEGEEVCDFEVASAEKLAEAFLQARCRIDFEIDTSRYTLETREETNGPSGEAETLSD